MWFSFHSENENENSATAYCVLVMFWISVIIFAVFIACFLIAHYLYDDNYSFLFWVANIFTVLFCLQFIAPHFLVKKLVKPLDKINQVSKALASGNFKADLKSSGDVREIRDTFVNFQIMAEELSGIETLRSDFLSNVSHEFKTPLASIEGYATLMQNPEITEAERQECVNHILSNTRRLSSLTGDILMLSKLENQKLKPEITTYRLDEQIIQILLQQEIVWNQKGIDLDLQIDEITYTGAEKLLHHVWANLINNAVKYSYPNSQIRISLRKQGKKIIFDVEDHGIGINEDAQKHIFEKFYQEDTDHKSEGNGLGLAQVKSILDMTENSIQVSSKIGSGSTFTVILTM